MRYPEIDVRLTGTDGNAFALMGRVVEALRRAAVSPEEIAWFRAQATSGDYDHLLWTCAKWVNVS